MDTFNPELIFSSNKVLKELPEQRRVMYVHNSENSVLSEVESSDSSVISNLSDRGDRPQSVSSVHNSKRNSARGSDR